jgi:hypothetical protein
MRDPYKQLDEESNMGKEARQEAREWALSVAVASVGAAALFALLWLGGAF